jgi:carboxypeptidase family protein
MKTESYFSGGSLMWIWIRRGLAIASLMWGVSVFAQSTNSGDIRGTITDTSGAVVQGTKITVLNVDTGISKDFTSNKDGIYDTSSIVPGHYKLTFTKDGFETIVRGPITLDVGNIAVNAQMQVGQITEQITVNEDAPLLNTEGGDKTTTLEAKSMAELPQIGGGNGPTWENFMILFPGSTGTPGSAQGSSNPGQAVSTNGNLPFSNVLADGASTTLPSSQNANPAVFEDVEEVQISLSSFSAQYGVGGMIINQITKGGASKFHGSAYEYFQNDALNAANFGFGQKVAVPFLRYNNFGGTISGPVKVLGLGKKAFFFFGYDQIVNNTQTTGFQSVPTGAVMSGDFTGGYTLYDPTTQTIGTDSKGNPYPIRKSFMEEYGTNAIPQSMFDKVAANFQKYYPTAANSSGHFVNGTPQPTGVIQNNWYDAYSNPRPWRRYFGRLDYDITPNNRLTMSDTQGDEIENGDNAVTSCPIGCQLGDVDNNNAQVTDVWNISPTTINEARFGFTDQLNFFSDPGTGKGFAQQLGWQYAKADVIPAVQFERTYPYAWIQPGTNAQYKEFVFDPSDVVTMIRGKHILHFGGEFAFYRDDSTPWGNINAGTFQFDGGFTQQWTLDGNGVASPNSGTGLEYADFLLGYASNWNASITPEYGARLKKPQMFIQDDIKLKPNFTLNVGLRYEISHGYNEVKGNEATFDPTVANTDGTLGAFWYGSTQANGRKSLQADVFTTFLPRVGFSWSPMPDTILRGGYGLYTYNFSTDNYGAGMGASVESSGAYSDQTNGIYPVTKFEGAGTLFPLGGGAQTALPYTAGSTDPGRFNGQSVNNFNDFHTPIPKIHQWNVGLERQFLKDWVAKLSYVASHGFNLTFPTDINAVPENQLSVNDSNLRPFKNFGSIQGNLYQAISNYNSLQAEITKRMTNGLTLSFNYVWSHMLDDQDSSGWGSHGGQQAWQHASSLTLNQASLNYGPSNFDVRNAFKGYAVYQLPFGRGRAFLNHNSLLDAVIGGWQLAGSLIESSGNPFSISGPNNLYTHANGATQYVNRVPGVSTTPTGGRSYHNWINEAAFSAPAAGAFGTVQRNPLVGPGLNVVNMGVNKQFSITEQIKFQLRCDTTNTFNHPSFSAVSIGGNGGVNLTGGGPGLPFTGTAPLSAVSQGGRTVQLTGRLSF